VYDEIPEIQQRRKRSIYSRMGGSRNKQNSIRADTRNKHPDIHELDKGKQSEGRKFVQLAVPCKDKDDGQIIIEKGNMRILMPLQTESEVLGRIFRSMESI
jgi:hypothetical protein